MPRGGRRTGAGRPPGKKDPQTLEKERVREAIRQRILRSADRIFNAQMSVAEGCSYLYRIEKDKDAKKSKKHVLVTSPEEIKRYLDGETDPEDYYYITTKTPQTDAIKDLWDRVWGKPSQSVELSGPNGQPVQVNHHYVAAAGA